MLLHRRHIHKLLWTLLGGAWVVFLPESSEAQDTAAFRSIIAAHYERYPLMEVTDLYKLIHQASLGSEHAIADTASARAWLENELSTMGDGPHEPIVDPLRPDSELVRIHLRSYVAAGGDPHVLLAAFVQTANRFSGSDRDLRKLWSIAEQMADEGSLPFEVAEMRRFMDEKETSGFPAVHHSAAYASAYRPAYRVVALRYLSTDVRLRDAATK